VVRRVRDGRLRTNIGTVSTLDAAVAAFNPTKRINGKTIIRVRPAAGQKARLDALGFDWEPRANKRRISPLAAE
jgi:hypothetical protein